MPSGPTADAAGDGRVYREIKARIVACAFGQGKPIRLGRLARQLGVSTTPVREALNMLTAKGLVINEPHKGFVTMRLSEDRFIGLYRLNQVLLNAALRRQSPVAALPAAVVTAVAGIGNDLDQGEQRDPDTIAKYTGILFSRIAALSNNAHVVESVARVNDNLYYIRTMECRQSQNIPHELMRICEQFLTEQFEELGKAITDYHENRLALLPDLMFRLRR